MEQIYHAALKAGETDAFKQAIDDSYAHAPENLLYAAWFHRLKSRRCPGERLRRRLGLGHPPGSHQRPVVLVALG